MRTLKIVSGDHDKVFLLSSTYFTEYGPPSRSKGSIPVFLRKHITTCDFAGGPDPPMINIAQPYYVSGSKWYRGEKCYKHKIFDKNSDIMIGNRTISQSQNKSIH